MIGAPAQIAAPRDTRADQLAGPDSPPERHQPQPWARPESLL